MSTISQLSQEFSIYNCLAGGGSFPNDGYETVKTIPDTIIAEATHGAYEVWTDQGHEYIEPGSFFLIPPMRTVRIAHHFDGAEQMQARWVHIKAKRFRHIDIFGVRDLPLKVLRHNTPELSKHFDALQTLTQHPEPLVTEALLYQQHCFGLAAALIQLASRRKNQKNTSDLAPVYQFIEHHLEQNITVSDLAACMHLSEARFYVVFKEKLGMSPKAWLQNVRLERAAHLLLQEDYGLEQIAQSCGFANAFHLSRLFKKWTGSAPSTWRKNHQQRII